MLDTKVDTPVALLDAALEVLHRGGWQQGRYGPCDNPDVPHCAVGALLVAEHDAHYPDHTVLDGAYYALEVACHEKYPEQEHGIISTNDLMCTDITDVESLFQRAREIATGHDL